MRFLLLLISLYTLTAKAAESSSAVVDSSDISKTTEASKDQLDLAERTNRRPPKVETRKYRLPVSLLGGISTSNYGFPGAISTSNPWGFCYGVRAGFQVNQPKISWLFETGFRTAQMNVVGNNNDYVWLDAIEIGFGAIYRDWTLRGGIAFNTSRVSSAVFNSTISDKGLYGGLGYELSVDGPWIWSVEAVYTTINYKGANNPGLPGDASSNQFEILAIYTYKL